MRNVENKSLNSHNPLEGDSCSVVDALRTTIVGAIKSTNLSRFDVAGMLTEMMGRNISKPILDKWLAGSSVEYRIPAEAIAPLCKILDTYEPLMVLASAIGCVVLEPGQAREMKKLKLQLQRQEIDEELRQLEAIES